MSTFLGPSSRLFWPLRARYGLCIEATRGVCIGPVDSQMGSMVKTSCKPSPWPFPEWGLPVLACCRVNCINLYNLWRAHRFGDKPSSWSRSFSLRSLTSGFRHIVKLADTCHIAVCRCNIFIRSIPIGRQTNPPCLEPP